MDLRLDGIVERALENFVSQGDRDAEDEMLLLESILGSIFGSILVSSSARCSTLVTGLYWGFRGLVGFFSWPAQSCRS